jgi:hypothetical protein
VGDFLGDHPIRAFVSADGKLSGDEIRFYTETLDQMIRTIQLLIAAAPTPIQNSAHFNNSDEIFCDRQAGDTANLIVCLSDEGPKDAFIIFQACAAARPPCRAAVHAVQFQ